MHELTVKQNKVDTELQDKKEENKPEEKTKTDKIDNSKEQKSISEKEPIISDTKDKGADLRGEDSVTVKVKEVEQSEEESPPVKGKQKDELKCEMFNYKYKKENAMKKHIKTKHVEQKCKTCDKVFPSTMEVLMHTASEHSKTLGRIKGRLSLYLRLRLLKKDILSFDIALKYKCFKCKEIVSIKDKFNADVQALHNVPGLWLTPRSGRKDCIAPCCGHVE